MLDLATSSWQRLFLTWLIYTITGVSCVAFAVTSDFVSPLFLAAGAGLACVLSWGPRMVWAVGVGGATVSVFFHVFVGVNALVPQTAAVVMLVGIGAGLQAWVALTLIRVWGGEDRTLEHPWQILRFSLLAGPLACLVSASVATLAMQLIGGLPSEQALHVFLQWWAGDTLGVLIGTPILMPLVAQPASLWRPRRQVVSIPLLITAVLLTVVARQLNAWHQERQDTAFRQSVETTTNAVHLRLQGYLHTIEAMHGLFNASDAVTRTEFREAARYWLMSLDSVQALGWATRVPMRDVPGFEAAQRREGLPHYRVFDGVKHTAPQGSEVVPLHFIERQTQNQSALGFNILSRPETRSTYERARDTDSMQATPGFRLIQEQGQQRGVVLYRPVYKGPTRTVAERRSHIVGTLFLTLRMDDALASILQDMPLHLAACLYENTPTGERLLGGPSNCQAMDTDPPLRHLQRVSVAFAGQVWTLKVWAQKPIPMVGDGATFWLLVVVGSLLATALGTLLLVMTGNARHLQEAMQEARRLHTAADQANRAKSEFMSRMSHELRTPLNAVLGFAQVMELDGTAPLPAPQRHRAQQIQQAGWHLLDMIDDVLDISRVDSGTMRLNCQPMSVGDALKAAASLIHDQAARRGITLHWPDQVPGEWGVNADATRLRQILTNLLSNAIKYNRPDGSVTVSVERRIDSTDQATLHIAVSDTGLGMSQSQQAQLFQPFNRLGRERSQTEGTGIGLVICRHLAELMSGSLTVQSRENEGSIFTLILPAIHLAHLASAPKVVTSIAAPKPLAQRRHHVLYVEDNPTNSELLRDGLQGYPGLSVAVATTAEQALAQVRNRALGPRPDLMLLDLHLPDASGLEVLQLLKANPDTAGIPVIMVSADAMPEQIQSALAAGAYSYQTKPVHLPALLQLISELLPG